MAKLITLNANTDSRGSLTVIQNEVNFLIKRVFYIFNVTPDCERGGHSHIKTRMALVCLGGSCEIEIYLKGESKIFILDNPQKLLLLNPEDWHIMRNFSQNATLLALASEDYNPDDYITERI